MISSAGMAISLIVIAFAFYMKIHMSAVSNMASILALIGLLAYIIAFSLGMGAIPWIIMSEILPTNVKGIAGSVATLANWALSWAVTMTINLLLEWSTEHSHCMLSLLPLRSSLWCCVCLKPRGKLWRKLRLHIDKVELAGNLRFY